MEKSKCYVEHPSRVADGDGLKKRAKENKLVQGVVRPPCFGSVTLQTTTFFFFFFFFYFSFFKRNTKDCAC
jgi:hypothetical protein